MSVSPIPMTNHANLLRPMVRMAVSVTIATTPSTKPDALMMVNMRNREWRT
jgi:hypothetical protein